MPLPIKNNHFNELGVDFESYEKIHLLVLLLLCCVRVCFLNRLNENYNLSMALKFMSKIALNIHHI